MSNFFTKSFEGKNKWYLYLATVLISFVGAQFVMAPIMIVYFLINDLDVTTVGDIPPTLGGFILILSSFVVIFVALWFCIKFIHAKKFINVITGRNRLDIKRIGMGVAIWGVFMLLSMGIEFAVGDVDTLQFQFDASKFFPLLIFALLLFPFQTTFEEIFFRGYLMQGIFLIAKNKWVPLLVSSILFAAMHGANTEVAEFGIMEMMSYYFAMGLFLGAITIFDDGLELAIGVHFIHNFISCMFVTSESSSLMTPGSLFLDTAPTMGYADTLTIIGFAILFIFVTQRIFKYKISLKK